MGSERFRAQWPHNTGPLMTYMASCGDTTCDQYNSTDAEWFKIDETGLEPGNVTWYQQNISASVLENVHITATLTCPATSEPRPGKRDHTVHAAKRTVSHPP